MMSIEECRRLLGRSDLTDEEIAEFLQDLRNFIGQCLDDFFREELAPDEEES